MPIYAMAKGQMILNLIELHLLSTFLQVVEHGKSLPDFFLEPAKERVSES